MRDAEATPDGGTTWTPLAKRGRRFEATPCVNAPCRVRYRYALRTAAQRLDDVDTANEEDDILQAPPSTWLLAPAEAPKTQIARFRVRCPEGVRFVTGVFRSPTQPDAWEIAIDDLWTAPYSAFGAFRVRDVPAKDGTIQLAIGPGKLAVSDEQLVQWTDGAARAIAAYFGRFPMKTALVMIVPARGRWIGNGKTLAGGGGTIWIRVGERAAWSAFEKDWVLVHEMTHLTFPSAPRNQNLAEEGLATYVEPFARARVGLVTAEEAWAGLVDGAPQGLPEPGDEGLDRTPTWGRTYWGGALFYLLADVEIRKRTQNRFGLEHALRAILDAGGNNGVRWPLEAAFDVGDRAVGVPVLRELHDQMGSAPHPVDLPALWRQLGVSVTAGPNGKVRFDDAAPLAAVRRAITTGSP